MNEQSRKVDELPIETVYGAVEIVRRNAFRIRESNPQMWRDFVAEIRGIKVLKTSGLKPPERSEMTGGDAFTISF